MLKKIVISLILLFVLIGCSNNNESDDTERTVTICEINSMANTPTQIDGNRTVTLEAVGDHVISMDEINRLDVERFSGLLGMSKGELLELWEEDTEFVREIILSSVEVSSDGVTSEIVDVTDAYFILRIVRNFDEMSLAELEHLVGRRVDFISLDEMLELIETLEGGTCIQQ